MKSSVRTLTYTAGKNLNFLEGKWKPRLVSNVYTFNPTATSKNVLRENYHTHTQGLSCEKSHHKVIRIVNK